AMAKIVSESGTSFDPAVVEVLARRFRELEAKAEHASEGADSPPALSTDICITRGVAPAAGFAVDVPSIAAPTRPVRSLAVDDSVLERLTIEEALAVTAVRAKPHLPHDAFVAYIKEAESFRLAYAMGHDRIPAGILKWVLENGRYIVNANPGSDPGYDG